MKRQFTRRMFFLCSAIFFLFGFSERADAAAYYLRNNGSAVNKEAAVGPCSDAAAAMNIATHNAQTFSAGDVIYMCDDGGDFSAKLIPPSSGSEGLPITYRPATGETPIFDVAGAQTVVIDSRKDYVTYEDMTVKNATVTNFYVLSGTGVTLTRIHSIGGAIGIRYAGIGSITLTDCTATGGVGATAHGFLFSGGTVTLNECSSSDNEGNGFVWDATSGKTLVSTATDCVSSANGINGFRAENAGTSTTVTLTGSTAAGNSEDGFNTWDDARMNVARCIASDNGASADTNSGDGFTAHKTSVMNIHSSLAYGNYKSGAAMTEASSGEIINCTFYSNTEATNGGSWDGAGDLGMGFNGTGAWIAKNNIIMGHPVEMLVSATAVAGGINLISDYNDFYDSLGGTAFGYGGTFYDFSDYRTISGQDAHSINQNPLFSNASADNFALQSSSPAVNAGTDVSLTIDFAGNPVPSGPDPDMGAYEFQDSTAPVTSASVASGIYESVQQVTLTCDDGPGVGCDKTYYTTDGSDPTTASSQYVSPLTISSTTTLKFFSQDENENSESAKTRVYTISIPPDSTPVYRFWSQQKQGHFYTTSQAEKDNVIANDPSWMYEGIAYSTFASSQQETSAVYRFWSDQKQHHFFTISSEEKDNIIATDPSWTYEGIAFFAYPSEQVSVIPVSRFWSQQKQGHFYTTSQAEKDNIIANDPSWNYEGIGWWVPAE